MTFPFLDITGRFELDRPFRDLREQKINEKTRQNFVVMKIIFSGSVGTFPCPSLLKY